LFQFSWADGLRGSSYDSPFRLRDEIPELEYTPRSLQGRRVSWWKFAKKPDVLVLLGRGLGCPIRCRPGNPLVCLAWAEVPRDHQLLIMTMPVLEALKRQCCTKRAAEPRVPNWRHPYHSRYMITNSIAKARPNNTRLFEACTGPQCNPVQDLRDMKLRIS
jgi:hypothetical protein